jgi:hypothetical protein
LALGFNSDNPSVGAGFPALTQENDAVFAACGSSSAAARHGGDHGRFFPSRSFRAIISNSWTRTIGAGEVLDQVSRCRSARIARASGFAAARASFQR